MRLIEFTPDHLTEEYVSWLNDNKVMRFSEQRHKTHTLKSCSQYLSEKESSEDYFLAIEVGAGGPFYHVGNIGVSVDPNNSVAELSIMVGVKKCWGTGVGTRAWLLAIRTLFDRLDIRLITAVTMSVNDPMRKLFRRSNMKIDALLPERFFLDGNYVDLVVASISIDEYRNQLRVY